MTEQLLILRALAVVEIFVLTWQFFGRLEKYHPETYKALGSPSFNCVNFFFQAEDGIRDKLVTGVQTCALPICMGGSCLGSRCDSHSDCEDGWECEIDEDFLIDDDRCFETCTPGSCPTSYLCNDDRRSEERRVGKECRCRWSQYVNCKKREYNW